MELWLEARIPAPIRTYGRDDLPARHPVDGAHAEHRRERRVLRLIDVDAAEAVDLVARAHLPAAVGVRQLEDEDVGGETEVLSLEIGRRHRGAGPPLDHPGHVQAAAPHRLVGHVPEIGPSHVRRRDREHQTGLVSGALCRGGSGEGRERAGQGGREIRDAHQVSQYGATCAPRPVVLLETWRRPPDPAPTQRCQGRARGPGRLRGARCSRRAGWRPPPPAPGRGSRRRGAGGQPAGTPARPVTRRSEASPRRTRPRPG